MASAHLDERHLLQRRLVELPERRGDRDLVVAEPDAAVQHREREHVVHERLHLAVLLGGAEDLRDLGLQIWVYEHLVFVVEKEGKHGPRTLQTSLRVGRARFWVKVRFRVF